MMFSRLFLSHPRAMDESYMEHFGVASGFGLSMIFAGFGCIIHALIPGLCTTTGSDMVRRLHDDMVTKRRARAAENSAAPLQNSGE